MISSQPLNESHCQRVAPAFDQAITASFPTDFVTRLRDGCQRRITNCVRSMLSKPIMERSSGTFSPGVLPEKVRRAPSHRYGRRHSRRLWKIKQLLHRFASGFEVKSPRAMYCGSTIMPQRRSAEHSLAGGSDTAASLRDRLYSNPFMPLLI